MELREEIVQEIKRLVNLGVEALVGKMPTGTQALDSGASKRDSVTSVLVWKAQNARSRSSGPLTRIGLSAGGRSQRSNILIGTP